MQRSTSHANLVPAMKPKTQLKSRVRPLVVYLHRYPPEIEAVQYPALRRLIELLKSKYDVAYCCMKPPGATDPDVRDGIKMLELPFRVDQTDAADKWIKTMLYYLCLPLVLWRIRQMRADFIICKETLPFVPLWVGMLGIPMSISTSDWWWSIFLGGSKPGRKVAHWLEAWEVRHWGKKHVWVAATSRSEADLVQRRGMPGDRIRVINAPMAPGVYGPCDGMAERARLGLGRDLWVVAVHGIIRPGKGYGQLLEWWREIVKAHPNWRLLIIGGAGGESWCRNRISRLGIESSVVMTGWLPTKKDVNRHLNAADCLLVVRRNSEDNVGLIPSALFNSLTTGKPTVATDLPGMAEVVRHGEDGFLFKPDKYESFLSVLEHVASHREEAERVGMAGLARAKECFDPEVAAMRHVELIDGVIGGGVKS